MFQAIKQQTSNSSLDFTQEYPWIQILTGIQEIYNSNAYNSMCILNSKEEVRKQKIDMNYKYIDEKKHSHKWNCLSYFNKSFYHLSQIYENKLTQVSNQIDEELKLLQQHQVQESKLDCHNMGRSGSEFYFSQNKQFILKTVSKSNFESFSNDFYKEYFKYFVDHQDQNFTNGVGHTLFSKVFGLFKFSCSFNTHYYIIMIENVFQQLQKSDVLLRMYDLKGSTAGRHYDGFEEELQLSKQISHFVQKDIVKGKDIDFKENYEDNVFCQLDSSLQQLLLNVLEKESNLLKNCNIMDYSVLLAVGQVNSDQVQENTNIKQNVFRRIQVNQYPNMFFCIALVDFLQQYDSTKKIEHAFKSFTHYLFHPSDNHHSNPQTPKTGHEHSKQYEEFKKNQQQENPEQQQNQENKGEDEEDWQLSVIDSESYAERIVKFIKHQIEGGHMAEIQKQMHDLEVQEQKLDDDEHERMEKIHEFVQFDKNQQLKQSQQNDRLK